MRSFLTSDDTETFAAEALTRVRGLLVVVGILAVASTCSTSRPGDGTLTQPALTTPNGLGQNGLTTNGIWTNGIWTNGIWTNGIWTNGIWTNGIWTNGIWTNGIWTNGIWTNGIWTNGIWTNGIWTNGLTGDAAVPGDALRSSSYARQLLQYIYSCAMPPTTYDTTLDPNDTAPLVCASDADCDIGYACSPDNRCVVPLKGAIGVGINADGTSWPASGTCDESCQRWVSACVLARTNAYGVHVQISMRAPADAPQAVKHALAVNDDPGGERETFSLREGAYYGNIFAETPTTGAPAGGAGLATGPIASTPQYFACAGPGSNIPEITNRFCSSQGDQVVIGVPGVCLATATQPGACTGEDTDPMSPTFGAIRDCFTTTDQGQQTATRKYPQVITVFLKQPIAVCGNAVCEAGEDSPSDPSSCLSDCHPGTWARDISPNLAADRIDTQPADLIAASQTTMSAVGPDDTVVVAGVALSDVDLGGGTLPVSAGAGVIAKYGPDGSYRWSRRFRAGLQLASSPVRVNGVAVGRNGDIAVVGSSKEVLPSGVLTDLVWLGEFTADGAPLGTPIAARGDDIEATRALAIDSHGDVLLAGRCSGHPIFGSATLSGSCGTTGGIWVAKVAPGGDVLWAQAANDNPNTVVSSLIVDSHDDLLLFIASVQGGASFTSGGLMFKESGNDGSLQWAQSPNHGEAFTIATLDQNGDVYVGGYYGSGQDLGAGPIAANGFPPYIAKYSGANGAFFWETHASTVCLPGDSTCGLALPMTIQGASIGFDPAGNVILGSYGHTVVGGGVDFGVGTFPTYNSNNIFVSAYSPDAGQLLWAKQLPMIVSSSLLGLSIDSQGRIILSGNYSGSMQVDDKMLVTAIPEQPSTIDSFVASFSGPSLSDTTPPTIGAARDQAGAPLFTMPKDIFAPATSSDGAVVFFMPPTAIDNGNAGTSVACSPPPNTTFSIGTTPVTCTASDPLGHHASATFSVTVFDRHGPVFSGVPNVPPVPAAGAGGAVVTYATPTANDQVDGPRLVTCAPASGTVFAVGPTTVTCTSSDAHGNTSTVSFTASVLDTTPPVLTLPGSITATATGANGAVVTYSATAVDDIDGPVTPVCAPPSGSTFSLRATTVKCTATDAAGNQAKGSFQVTVQYGWSGILQPVDADGGSVFKLGSTIPVKFALAGASAGITNAVATLTLAKISSNVTGFDVEAISTSAATTGNLFRYTGGQYLFNLATKTLSVGTWQLSIDLGDGVRRTVLISLR